MKLRTNAKVNLFLKVVGARADGFHEVETILHGIGLADDLVVTAGGDRIGIEMILEPPVFGLPPQPEDNLIFRAATKLLARDIGATVAVTKRIPFGAGLGGGSANAAGMLVALNEMWGLGRDDLMDIAAELGSDVPYCLTGGTVLATGRGVELNPLPGPRDLWFVLGISTAPLATASVYERFDQLGVRSDVRTAPMTMALGSGDVADIADLLHNDLEAAAFDLRPELAPKKKALVDAGAMGVAMSGSGPTLFGIVRNESEGRAVASKVEDVFDAVIVTGSRPQCVERVG